MCIRKQSRAVYQLHKQGDTIPNDKIMISHPYTLSTFSSLLLWQWHKRKPYWSLNQTNSLRGTCPAVGKCTRTSVSVDGRRKLKGKLRSFMWIGSLFKARAMPQHQSLSSDCCECCSYSLIDGVTTSKWSSYHTYISFRWVVALSDSQPYSP